MLEFGERPSTLPTWRISYSHPLLYVQNQHGHPTSVVRGEQGGIVQGEEDRQQNVSYMNKGDIMQEEGLSPSPDGKGGTAGVPGTLASAKPTHLQAPKRTGR